MTSASIEARATPWQAEIGCEGGPVLVANFKDFLQWHGSEPIDPGLATELHYYSPFTRELPECWQPNGPTGHQYLASAEPAKRREDLIACVLAQWPGTIVDRSGSQWSATRPDGRALQVALSPGSEYDRAIRRLATENVYAFGDGASAYLWGAVPGMVRIHLNAARNMLYLFQVEFAEDDADAEHAYEQALAAASAPAEQGIEYRVTAGPVMVAWSPNSARDLQERVRADDTGATVPGRLLDLSIAGTAALVWLEPGAYMSTTGYLECDTWGVAWCRLRRL
jgi:hypothetical protein